MLVKLKSTWLKFSNKSWLIGQDIIALGAIGMPGLPISSSCSSRCIGFYFLKILNILIVVQWYSNLVFCLKCKHKKRLKPHSYSFVVKLCKNSIKKKYLKFHSTYDKNWCQNTLHLYIDTI